MRAKCRVVLSGETEGGRKGGIERERGEGREGGSEKEVVAEEKEDEEEGEEEEKEQARHFPLLMFKCLILKISLL